MGHQGQRRLDLLVLCCVAIVASALVSGSSLAPPSGAAPRSPAGATPLPGGPLEPRPSAAEVLAQAQARQLRQVARQQGAATTAARDVLAAAAEQASASLERYRQTVGAQRAAQVTGDLAVDRLDTAERDLQAQRADLGRWAREAYVQGGALTASPALATLLDGGSPDDVSQAAVWLARIGEIRGRATRTYAAAAAVQSDAARRAEAAGSAADAAVAAAQQARAERDAAVEAQRQTVARLETALGSAQDAAADAERRARLLAQARAATLGSTGIAIGTVAGNVGVVGACAGEDTTRYSNGVIPLAALCPLWGAAGDYLRADAAAAFDQLSTAYAQTFGQAICVTDSYRSYPEQVQVYARTPALAAVPGTSNHGWGTAADLCGGIQSFGSPTHVWMLANAPTFGWFHPSWAEPGGGTPEAWHWEFGG